MQNWAELEAYVLAHHTVTQQSEYVLFLELDDGTTAMVQEGAALGLDYETIRVEVSGFEDDEDSAYQVLKAVSAAGNGLLTCEELAGRLFVRHIIPTLALTGQAFDAFLNWVASVAAQVRAQQLAGALRPQPD